ncbi:zinc finger CCCH domain-containing protein 14 isoform X2 [Momordica charantia]|nr:zinc finger CCCH domain-containing protein 14 isoform X2 [Momordica charantia]XP_022134168.1 zinc finger CCCH domain-containing protein 14 isoform X2 [Momordica charantia]XP_022134169.1 zinc finger CCCH domain-containing protein 14 isoform X2 [Momordica charantia]
MEEEDMSPPLPSSLPATPPEFENFGVHFASMYHSIFPPLSTLSLPSSLSFTPSPCSSAVDDDDHSHSHTDELLFEAGLVLESRELWEQHDLCLRRLREVSKEADYLRRENAQIRSANAELVKLVSSKIGVDDIISPTSVIRNNNNQFEGMIRNRRRVIALPNSISVRSATPATAPLLNIQSRRVCAPASGGGGSGKREEEEAAAAAMELELYNQGMAKTELCNKWRETGGCPYGDHCRFAHGVEELRPVIRHPRYKTQMCRMVLAGDTCPYGHRCHFRHSLNHRER